MPQKSKNALKKAPARATRVSTKALATPAKAPAQGNKRSVAGKSTAATQGKPKGPTKPAKGAASSKVERPKPVARKAPLKTPSKAKPRSAKPGARTMHALILPPKPKRLAARLLVARAPRAARVEKGTPDSSREPSLGKAATRPTLKLSSAKPTTERTPAAASLVGARIARATVTLETWRAIESMAVELGRPPLNDEQRVAVRAALEGHDSVVVLPDDERAVSCYQLAAFQLRQPTVVVSPVTAELKAQHEVLSTHRLPVVYLPGELAGPERSAALARIARGGALLVLLNPEGLHAPDVRQALAKSGIGLFVVEEAHCASDASHEIRPSYAALGVQLRELGSPPVMAITRVATASVRRDIRTRLGLEAPVSIQSRPVRENLQIVTKLARGEGRQAALVRLVERLTLPGLVFCATPHDVDSVYSALRAAGIAAHRHHSAMTASDRAAELSSFSLPGQRSVMVAVSAFAPGSGLPGIGEQAEASLGFGRGPGKRDLRFVVHYQSPASLEQYLREVQCAGVDSMPATCVLLHESSHRTLHEAMLAQQRFRATHLAELGRALETPALEGRTVSLEALALSSGQSRRTTDRLTALLADAGVLSRAAGWIRVLCTATELDEACRRLGAQLYALREQDARRLAAVSAFAEASECKLSCLSQYLGEGASQGCGRCNACVSELLPSSQESLVAPSASMRRGAVQEFSVQAASAPSSGVVAKAGSSAAAQPTLSAKLADYEVGAAGKRPRE